MLESENSSMAERLYDLERQVLEQQEEILSLKSTLSEVLRRLNNLDCNSSRISSSTSSSSSYETTIKNNRSEYRLEDSNYRYFDFAPLAAKRQLTSSSWHIVKKCLHHALLGCAKWACIQSFDAPHSCS